MQTSARPPSWILWKGIYIYIYIYIYTAVLTLNFDLSKVSSHIWHRCWTSTPNYKSNFPHKFFPPQISPPFRTNLTYTGLFHGFSYSSVYFFLVFFSLLVNTFFFLALLVPSHYWLLLCLFFGFLYITIIFSCLYIFSFCAPDSSGSFCHFYVQICIIIVSYNFYEKSFPNELTDKHDGSQYLLTEITALTVMM